VQLEERVAKIEGIIEQMNERLNHIETDLGTLREETKSEIRDLRSDLTHKIESNFKWTIGLMLTMWVTIILTIIFHS
jgi:tetrahydromethanopterin S-methyltransferase subunit B